MRVRFGLAELTGHWFSRGSGGMAKHRGNGETGFIEESGLFNEDEKTKLKKYLNNLPDWVKTAGRVLGFIFKVTMYRNNAEFQQSSQTSFVKFFSKRSRKTTAEKPALTVTQIGQSQALFSMIFLVPAMSLIFFGFGYAVFCTYVIRDNSDAFANQLIATLFTFIGIGFVWMMPMLFNNFRLFREPNYRQYYRTVKSKQKYLQGFSLQLIDKTKTLRNLPNWLKKVLVFGGSFSWPKNLADSEIFYVEKTAAD